MYRLVTSYFTLICNQILNLTRTQKYLCTLIDYDFNLNHHQIIHFSDFHVVEVDSNFVVGVNSHLPYMNFSLNFESYYIDHIH